MKRWAGALLTLAALMLTPVSLRADLKDYVVLIKPLYHQKTRALFLELAESFKEKGSAEGQKYFTALAGEHAFGSGWVVVDADGQNYVITNRHVVIGAEKVNIYIESVEGDQKAFLDCPILYVDPQMDLAVAQFPGAQKVFKTGFKLDTRPEKDLTEVVAAGYPGFGGEPLWQVSLGNITNSQARIDPAYSYLIQHSAPIDPGNSGGPLLVKDPSTPLGYSVAGVNTFKALKRESTNFAIPAKHVAEVLEKAKKARRLAANPAALRTELVKASTTLAGELNSDTAVDQTVNQFISYAIVGEEGWQAFTAVRKEAQDQGKYDQWFLDDPVEAMRTSIYACFRAEVESKRGTAVAFTGVNPADSDAIGGKSDIRTIFTIGGAQKEIVWTWEYGQWRISNVTLDVLQTATPAAASAQAAAASPAAAPKPADQTQPAGVVYNMHSLVFAMGAPGPFISVEYTGMIFWPVPVGLSASVGYTFDNSFFVLGGPAVFLTRGFLLPLRLGVALTSLGTSFVVNPGVLFKLGWFSVGVDLGYAFSYGVIFGAGFGIEFPTPPAEPPSPPNEEEDY